MFWIYIYILSNFSVVGDTVKLEDYLIGRSLKFPWQIIDIRQHCLYKTLRSVHKHLQLCAVSSLAARGRTRVSTGSICVAKKMHRSWILARNQLLLFASVQEMMIFCMQHMGTLLLAWICAWHLPVDNCKKYTLSALLQYSTAKALQGGWIWKRH